MGRLGRYFRRLISKKYNSEKLAFHFIQWKENESSGILRGWISLLDQIRMEKHKDALDTYAIAESHGLRLRDHFVNKCRCQISLGRLVDAFETAQMIDPLQQYDPLPSISKSLRGYKNGLRGWSGHDGNRRCP